MPGFEETKPTGWHLITPALMPGFEEKTQPGLQPKIFDGF
jgi:hypothetical protein